MNIAKMEPVTLSAAITAALLATVNLLAYLLDWSDTATQLVNICVAAWVLVASMVVRQMVTPTSNVALTNNDVALIEAGRAEGIIEGTPPPITGT